MGQGGTSRNILTHPKINFKQTLAKRLPVTLWEFSPLHLSLFIPLQPSLALPHLFHHPLDCYFLPLASFTSLHFLAASPLFFPPFLILLSCISHLHSTHHPFSFSPSFPLLLSIFSTPFPPLYTPFLSSILSAQFSVSIYSLQMAASIKPHLDVFIDVQQLLTLV